MTEVFLPFSAPDISEAEISAVTSAMKSGWVTTGPESAAFEKEFGEFVGGGVECIAVNSATAGLHLALEALGVGPGDEVIVPTWTFTATAEVVRYLGATPVIVDVAAGSLNLDIAAVKTAVTPSTKALIVVHFAGLGIDMVDVSRQFAGTGVKIIEDAAHALPTMTSGVFVGSALHSDAAVFSFYANKTMTTGEGGMIATRDPSLARRARIMRLHGIDRDVFDRYKSKKPSWFYDVVAPGYKYNMPDLAAAVGRVQLRRLAEMTERRRSIAEIYTTSFADLPVELPEGPAAGDVHAWHLYVLRSRAADRDAVIASLASRGVGASVHFIPLHRLTYWKESLDLSPNDYPNAERAHAMALSLPLFSKMTDEDVSRVVAAVRQTMA